MKSVLRVIAISMKWIDVKVDKVYMGFEELTKRERSPYQENCGSYSKDEMEIRYKRSIDIRL